MNSATPCPRCGAPLPGGAGSICVLCAGRLALDTSQSEADAEVPPALGVRLGDYELLAELGRGAMGAVYRARQVSLKRDVALKIVLSGQFASDADRKRFLTEAELAATLDHPNIVPVLEVGDEGGRPFCAMKFVEGRSLAVLLRAGFCSRRQCEAHRPPPKLLPGMRGCCVTAAALMAKIARAVHHAHQRGVIHRDLKPANIIMDAAGEPHITDFGLARRLGADSSLTLTGSPLGTPAYMSPEQARGEKTITTGSDIWSLGVMLYELLAGRPPFEAENVPALLRKISEDEPPAFPIGELGFTNQPTEERAHRKSPIGNRIDPDLATICLKCLEKDPAKRYGSAEALADDLERFQRDEPIRARPLGQTERLWRWCRRNRKLAAMTAAALTLLLIVTIGSPLAAVRINRERRRAVAAEREQFRLREEARTARAQEVLTQQQTEAVRKLEQARILCAAGRNAEAERLLGEVPALFIHVDPERAVTVLRVLRDWRIQQRHWPQASRHCAALLMVDPFLRLQPHEGSEEVTLDYLRYAALLVETGERVGYERLRWAAIARFAESGDLRICERLLKLSLLLPADDRLMAALEKPAGLARRFAGDTSHSPWADSSLALESYRRGHYSNTVAWSQRVLNATEEIPARNAAALAMQAAAYWQLQSTKAARIALARSHDLVTAPRRPNDAFYWHDWFVAQVLLREAANLIATTAP